MMEPVAWVHHIKEPDGNEFELLSRSSGNSYSHWLEKHRDQCTYTATPLVRLSDAEARIAELERENQELRIGIWRLSEEEELCGETMPEEDAFDLVRMAARLAQAEARADAAEALLKEAREVL